MQTFKTIGKALEACQVGDTLVRVRLPADSLYIVVPAHAAADAYVDVIDAATGRCVGEPYRVSK